MGKKVNKFRDFIGACLAFVFYRVKWETPREWSEGRVNYRFWLEPRKIVTVIIFVVFSPLIILAIGIKGFVECFKHWKPVSYTSYCFLVDKDDPHPRNWEAYKKF